MSIDIKNSNPGFALLGVGFYSGSGAPTHTATLGSIYVNLAGTDTDDRIYINIDGADTWTYLTAGT